MARNIDYYPRSFRYCDVPVFQGSRLLAARDDIEYQFYLEWLATYLDSLLIEKGLPHFEMHNYLSNNKKRQNDKSKMSLRTEGG